MKTLATEFKKHGFNFKQEYRNGEFAVFSKTKGNVISYETIVIRRHNGYKIGEIDCPASEVYPNDKAWGNFGFTYRSKEDAMEKVNTLETISIEVPEKSPSEKSVRGRKKMKVDLMLPDGDFTMKELVALNKTNYGITALRLKELLKYNNVAFVKEMSFGRGKPTKVYKKI